MQTYTKTIEQAIADGQIMRGEYHANGKIYTAYYDQFGAAKVPFMNTEKEEWMNFEGNVLVGIIENGTVTSVFL